MCVTALGVELFSCSKTCHERKGNDCLIQDKGQTNNEVIMTSLFDIMK